jgi:hypothetical protein
MGLGKRLALSPDGGGIRYQRAPRADRGVDREFNKIRDADYQDSSRQRQPRSGKRRRPLS